MLNSGVARQYAKALFDLARDSQIVDPVESELDQALQVLWNEEDIRLFWIDPLVQPEEKQRLLAALLDPLKSPVGNFLRLLIQKNREDILDEAFRIYKKLANDLRGITEAVVITAVQLSDDRKEALSKQLGVATGKQVRIRTEVDTSLIGGVVVKIDGRIIDGSLANRLGQLQAKLVAG